MLGKIGLVCTTPATLATAPTDLGGFGLMSFEIEQLTQHIGIMMQHGSHRQSTTSKLLRSTLEYHALESGFSGDPLSFPELQYVTRNTWISQTIGSLRKYNIQMTSDIEGLSSWCRDDIFLMEILNKQLPQSTLAIINKVRRLYLRINTLSDFLSADGHRFDRRLLTGHRSNSNPQPSYYKYRWPNVPAPTNSERSIWAREISSAFGLDLVTGQRRESSSLCWLPASTHFSRWLYSSDSGLVYERISPTNQWATWTAHFNRARYNTRANSRTFIKHGTTDKIPTNVIPVSIITNPNHHITITSTRMVFDEETPTVATSHQTQTSTDPRMYKFLYNIILHNGIIFSDGSYDCGRATYAIVADFCGKYSSLEEIDYTTLLCSADLVDGSKRDLNSYRAELRGILAAIEFTNTACNSMKITTGACTLYCDCKGALSAAFGHKRPTPRWSSFDLVSAIRNALAVSPIQWRHCHIKAHQDDTSTFENLNTLAQGNIIADHLASMKLRDNDQASPGTQARWRPQIDGQVICGDLPTRLHSAIVRPHMEERWKRMLGIGQHRCNWNIFFEAIASQPQHHRYTLIKYHAHLLPIGKNLVRRKHANNGTCPGCGEFEDHEHLLTCTHKDMESSYIEEIDKITTWLSTTSSEHIKDSVITLLQYFRQNNNISMTTNDTLTLATLQIPIGRRAFFAGAWHSEWLTAQESFHQETHPKRSAKRWLIQLIHRIQMVPVAMWHTRNSIMHSHTTNYQVKAQHDELNAIIDHIFSQKPHSRTMSHCDSNYFAKYTSEQIKNMKTRRKTTWITGANLILTKYERQTTSQSARFVSFFQWDDGG